MYVNLHRVSRTGILVNCTYILITRRETILRRSSLPASRRLFETAYCRKRKYCFYSVAKTSVKSVIFFFFVLQSTSRNKVHQGRDTDVERKT